MSIRLNLGSGPSPLHGYENVDRCFTAPIDRLGNATVIHGEAWPLTDYVDESVDEVRASHVLEHFPKGQTADVLREWVRVLKPGGVIKIAVPDFRYIAQAYVEGSGEFNPGHVTGGQVDENDFHKAIFDADGLGHALQALGLVDIKRWTSEVDDCASLPVSLNLQGRKPIEGEEPQAETEPEVIIEDVPPGMPLALYQTHPDRRFAGVRIPHGEVRALMTAPRLGFLAHAYDSHRAFSTLDIPWQMAQGVFWTDSIERAVENEIAEGAKYCLVTDYDTLFDFRDVQTLYGLMESRPDIGALCAVQMRREMGVILVGIRDPETNAPMTEVSLELMSKDVLPVSSGHFGLTLLRSECVTNTPKPWFHAKPGPDGGWGAGRVDADVAFWYAFAAAGHKLYQANRVVVGHIEQMVTWPDRHLGPMVQTSGEYHAHGRPGKESPIWR